MGTGRAGEKGVGGAGVGRGQDLLSRAATKSSRACPPSRPAPHQRRAPDLASARARKDGNWLAPNPPSHLLSQIFLSRRRAHEKHQASISSPHRGS